MTNTVIVAELNYGVTVDEANNITVEVATPSVGYTGYTGSAGSAGPIGNTGPIGFTGSIGSTGFTGSVGGIGLTGFTGSVGIQGPIGLTGSVGNTGATGDIGFTGSAGIQGIAGVAGAVGFTGSAGSNGAQGIQGVTGFTGSAGSNGAQGIQGVIGFTGSAGDSHSELVVWADAGDIPAGTLVMDAGGYGDGKTWVVKWGEYGFTTPRKILGITNATILYGESGSITTYGLVPVASTIGSGGGEVVASLTVPGAIEPYIGPSVNAHPLIFVGWSVADAAGNVFVKLDTTRAVDELDGVSIVSPTAGQALGYNGSVWVNTSVVGYTGSAGANGAVGFTGSTGYTGSKGADGIIGVDGAPGYTGSVGYAGSKGDMGYTGSASTVPGPAGTNGIDGATGYTGSIGYTGSVGAQGPIGYTGSQGGNTVTVSSPAYSATMSVDITNIDVIRITLTGNLTLGFTGGVDGQKFIVELTQDATGSRTLAYDSSVIFGTDLTSTTLTTTATKTDRIGFIYNATAAKYAAIAFAKGY